MSAAPVPSPYLRTLRWFAAHANFPASRLPVRAEQLVLMAVAAEIEEVALQRSPRFLIERRDGARDSALKAHAMNRSLVHYVCDNSAKV